MEKGKQTERHPERRWEKRDEKEESFKIGKKKLSWRVERAREMRRGQKEIRRDLGVTQDPVRHKPTALQRWGYTERKINR